MRHGHWAALALALLCTMGRAVPADLSSSQSSENVPRIDAVAFFGYEGLDLDAVRLSLPIREGDELPSAEAEMLEWTDRLRTAIKASTRSWPTDVAVMCCSSPNHYYVYIGLPGKSTSKVAFHPLPAGHERLEPAFLALCRDVEQAFVDAVYAGKAAEDYSHGYSLSTDSPELRALQLSVRDYAQDHASALVAVIRGSSDATHRAFAATALGYGTHDASQTRALADAILDSDERVRNAAMRALGVMLRAEPGKARHIDITPLVSLLKSGTWMDRNKASFLASQMTQGRDARILNILRTQALPQLKEMARWPRGHSATALQMLGRIAGIEEGRLEAMVAAGRAEDLIDLAQR